MLFKNAKLYLSFVVLFYFIFLNCISGQIKLGLKLGYNSSNLDYGKNKKLILGLRDYNELTTFHLGLTSNINLKKKFGLGIELFYIGKGFDGRPGLSNLNLENNFSLPVIFTYEVLKDFRLLAGLESNYIFSRYWVNGLEFTSMRKRIPSEEYKKLDNFKFGPVIGLQYSFANCWALDFRYVRVLDSTPTGFIPIYMRTYIFSLHYIFGN